MKIDWFVLISQMVNFLILVALLKHFLYNRIVKVMDEREQKIADRIDEAESKKKQADDELQEYKNKKQELDDKQDDMLDEAQKEAEKQKKELVKKARAEVEDLRDRWKESVENEQQEFLRELQQKIGDQVYAISRRVLKDLASEDLEKQIIAAFIDRVQDMDEEEQSDISGFVKEKDNVIQINSAFEISYDLHDQIEKALEKKLSQKAKFNFDVGGDMICGVEMKLDGQKVVWSIDSYLSALEERFKETMKEQVKEKKEEEE
jgi:F-type H+-transporting ATPase subunit b